MAEVRLQKVLARAGVASRREAERMIAAGRVRVDGRRVTRLGTKVDPRRAAIELDGRPIAAAAAFIHLALHKPRQVVATVRDPQGRTTIMDLLGELGAAYGRRRVFHVGRLDYHSEGLLLLTNDGRLAQALTHPSSQVPRVYRARVRGRPPAESLRRLVAGVDLEDGPAVALDAVAVGANPRSTWIEIGVAEGRNRLVRRMFDAIGHPVQRLVRTEYGGVGLGDLRPGAVRPLTEAELERLRNWRPVAEQGQGG
jgi:pseudouridine synthase